MATDVTRTFEVEVDARLHGAVSIGDALLTLLEARLEDPVVAQQPAEGLVSVAAGLSASDPAAAAVDAMRIVRDALERLRTGPVEFVGLRARLVDTDALVA
jgi:hypothetical protein